MYVYYTLYKWFRKLVKHETEKFEEVFEPRWLIFFTKQMNPNPYWHALTWGRRFQSASSAVKSQYLPQPFYQLQFSQFWWWFIFHNPNFLICEIKILSIFFQIYSLFSKWNQSVQKLETLSLGFKILYICISNTR